MYYINQEKEKEMFKKYDFDPEIFAGQDIYLPAIELVRAIYFAYEVFQKPERQNKETMFSLLLSFNGNDTINEKEADGMDYVFTSLYTRNDTNCYIHYRIFKTFPIDLQRRAVASLLTVLVSGN